ncbi:MAG TPA: SpoIIE family protein phosphatase [Bryobacteraceae bacterium]|nr:SpoIIE family protein phosphatase [Bryobacteraceae bacterium]
MTRSIQRQLAGYLAAIGGMILVTAICCLLRERINEMTVALAMLLVVLFVASTGMRGPAVVASVLGMLLLNYYFLPPIYTLTIEDPKNWIALGAFFITVLVAGRLAGHARLKAAEAEAERQEARRAAAATQLLARLQATVAELGQEALRREPSQKVMEEAVVLTAKTLGIEYCKVLELLPDDKELLLRAGVGWKEGLVGHATVPTGLDSQAGFTLLSEQPVVVEDLRTETRFSGPPLLHDHGVVSGMSVIIPTSEGPYGVLGAHTTHRRTFTTDEVNFLRSVANVLGSMIERRRDDEALRKSGEELRDLYNNAPCGYHSLDKDGVYVQVNDTELSWLGCTREEMIGKKNFADLLTPETLGTFRENYPKFKAQGEIHDIEYDLVRKDGTVLPVLVSATAITDAAGRFVASRSVMWDITARRQAEIRIRRLAELQAVVAELGQQALRREPFEKVFDEAVARMAEVLAVDYARVLELQPSGDALLLRAGVGWKEGVVGRAVTGVEPDSQAAFTLASKGPVILEDLGKETRFHIVPMFGDPPVVSGMSTVIGTSRGPYGVLGVHTRRLRTFTRDEVNFLRSVANVLGTMIERRQADAQLWRVSQAQRVLSKCNEALIRATEEPGLLQQICDVIVEEAGYRLCWVGRAENDEAKSVTPIAHAGFEAGYLATLNVTWADTERGHGPTGTSIRTRQTVVMRHIASDPAMALWRAEALKRGYASSVSIPLLIDAEVFGALMIYAAEPEAFASEEVVLLSELASDLAFGIQTLRTRARIQLLLDSTAEAICGLNLKGDCTWVNQSCVKMLGYSRSEDFLGKNLHSLVHYARADGTRVPQESCYAHKAIREAASVHVDDDVMWRADGTPFPVEYWSHPMRQNGTNVGAIVTFLDITERKRAAELQLANQAMKQAREREIEIGNRIQQTLLLDRPPQDFPGLRVSAITIPSQRIDGDFYIFLPHSEGRLDVIVGDVMGKGVPAALLGAATKTHFLRALSDLMMISKGGAPPEPREVVMLAHAELARHLIDLDSFVTLAYARFDEVNHSLSLVDCGHTGIIHWHARTRQCAIVHGDNLPLGVEEGEIYEQLSLPFLPGDLLLFFSDGITEARNGAGELFGEDRFLECVRANGDLDPAALVEAIRKAVSTFSGSTLLTDDLTLVAVRIEKVELAVKRDEIELESSLEELRKARRFVRGFCASVPGARLDEEAIGALELAVNEATSNVIKHAYHGRSDQWIHLEAEAFPGRIAIRLHHFGDPFDPSLVPAEPPGPLSESGRGAWIIRQSVDEVKYYRDERGRNCVALTKFPTRERKQDRR